MRLLRTQNKLSSIFLWCAALALFLHGPVNILAQETALETAQTPQTSNQEMTEAPIQEEMTLAPVQEEATQVPAQKTVQAPVQEIPPAPPQETPQTPVEINGDQVEFITANNTVVAEGNVVITQKDTKLTCDRVEFSRDTKLAIATGHVILSSPQGTIEGEKLTYNFEKMTGDFVGARISSNPYYGAGETISKVSEKKIEMKRGYLTTCDLHKPHFRLYSKKLDLYPGDKVVARSIRMIVGKVPMTYLPRMTQKLNEKPWVTYTPGYDKQWGMYLLTKIRYHLNDNFKGTLHVDAREKKDRAIGTDLKYRIKNMGSGTVRLYYMNERNITSKRFYQLRPSPTIEAERFRAEWRHKWAVDSKTDVILQYYKVSDQNFIREYFKREYESDYDPTSYFLLTRLMSNGTFSFRTDARVNHFTSAVQRLPEIRYDVSNQELGNTGLFLKSENGFANLSLKNPSPTEVRKETMRFDSNNELSYPMKISFIELKPFVGGRQTYYSKTNDDSRYNIIRGIFATGSSLSTNFYRLYDITTSLWGVDISRLRHVVTPSVAYKYTHRPTVPPTSFDVFDSVDSLDSGHTIDFSLENKFQTKRNGSTIDLLRILTGVDYHLKEDRGKGGFGNVSGDIEFKPASWLEFYSDTNYDTVDDKLVSTNFDIYLRDKKQEKWSIDFGKRYSPAVDDQITTGINYKLNPKWKLGLYGRYDVLTETLKEQEIKITRDLHCWELDINFNQTRGEGSEIWLVFTLKAFPDMTVDLGSSFNRRKAGSQSSGE